MFVYLFQEWSCWLIMDETNKNQRAEEGSRGISLRSDSATRLYREAALRRRSFL